ncbi:MAG: cohesin domain-containing protein [Halobacteriota archaeon]
MTKKMRDKVVLFAIIAISVFASALVLPAYAANENVVVGITSDPAISGAAPGDTATVPIIVYNVTDLAAGTLNVTYNSSVCTVADVTAGDLPIVLENVSLPGLAIISTVDTAGHNGTVTFANLEIEAIGSLGETSPLNITVTLLGTCSAGAILPANISVNNGTFTVTGAQRWYLHNDTIMYKGNESKPGGTITIANGTSSIWRADEQATVDVGFPAGKNWTGRIMLNESVASGNSNSFTVHVGSFNGSVFISHGSQTINGDGGTTYFLSISVGTFTITTNEFLALQINSSGADLKVKTGGGNSFLTSPESDPSYPIPELSSIILFSIGLLVLAAYILRKRSGLR